MKKLLLLLLYVPLIGFGQMQSSIVSLTVSPTYPTETDTIYIYASLSFSSSSCPLDVKSYGISGNNISASTQHCLGMLAAICYSTDTFKINPLPTGTYAFDLTLSSGFGGPPCTPGVVPDDYDTISFNVSAFVGIEEDYTNKKLIQITDVFGRKTKKNKNKLLFYIYDDGTIEKKIIIK